MKNIILELKAQNHPRVMSHVLGLLTRRAVDLNGVIYRNSGNNNLLKIFLMINNKHGHEQIMKQLLKLHDIIDVSVHEGSAGKLFEKIG